ncbi:MAG: galactose-1-phosphate uridylyltransferase [Chitinophagales bacterium]
MSELRYNPLLNTYTIVAAIRQNRPNFPKDWCPFCPGEGKKVPNNYEVLVYPNDFPALDYQNEIGNETANETYSRKAAKGACEVILYSPNHTANLYDLSDAHVLKLVKTWVERFNFHKNFDDVKYIFPFENRGKEVGVTMPHPHGQLYAYPFIPQKIETEITNSKKYFEKHQVNLFDVMLKDEIAFQQRVVLETETFLVYLPFFTDYPYGIFIVSKKERLYISDFNEEEQLELSILLKKVVRMFDNLFAKTFPFMMCIHQGVVNSIEYPEAEQREFYRFHIEFYPPLRDENAIKYYASSEMGAWAAANTKLVEETAKGLRNALPK